MDSTFAYRRPSPPPSTALDAQPQPRPSSSSGPSARPSSSSSYAQQQQSNYRPTSSHQQTQPSQSSISPVEYRPMSSSGPPAAAYSYGVSAPGGGESSALSAEGGWRDQQQQQPPTSLDPAQLTQPAYSHHPPPLTHQTNSYGGFTPVPPHPGANLRNTRPMTAPSSLAPPYFHSHHHQNHHSQPSGMYAVQEYPSGVAPQQAQGGGSFQYHVDAGGQYGTEQDHIERERGFSLPELVGGGQEDHQRYAQHSHGGEGGELGGGGGERRYSTASAGDDGSPGNSTFFYAPPPQQRGAGQGHQAQHSYQTDDSDYRRPTTGNSSSGGPTRTQHHHSSVHHDPYGRPLSGYDDEGDYSHSPEENYGPRGGSSSGGKTYNFVSQAGHASKRPRRRFDEIERLYTCDYPGCSKAYGTLNHLNSHKTMQKHGPRSTPAQFKELRKAWRDNKKQQAAALARGDVPPPSLIPAAAELKAMGGGGRQRSMSNVGQGQGTYFQERARPSTSAGEYHSAVPAFMTSVGTPIQAVGGAPQVTAGYGSLALPPPPAGMHSNSVSPGGAYGQEEVVANPGQLITPHAIQGHTAHYPQVTPQPGWGTSFGGGGGGAYSHQDEAYGSPHRPVTAPSMYSGVPAFGYTAPSAQGFSAAGLAQGQRGGEQSPFAYMPQPHHATLQAPQARRLSLPLVGAPGSETKFGSVPGFGAIQEEVGLVGGEEDR